MKVQSIEKVINCYNNVAQDYAIERIDELAKKRMDRLILTEFASTNKNKGPCADLGCGPGQTTKFLYDHGVKQIIGVDISSGMIDTARKLFPEITFQTGDLLDLSFKSDYLGSCVAFYSIVHFTYDQIEQALKEINRVLKKGGQFVFSYHVGEDVVHFDNANGLTVDIDLYYLQTDKILELVGAAGFKITDALERYPYEPVEYASRRAYIWTERK